MTDLDSPASDGPAGAGPPLGQRVLTALAFAGTARLLVQLASWFMTLFVIRLLTPADYGLMGLATIFTSFVAIFNELGMGTALVQARRVTPLLLREIFGIVILLQLGFALLMIVCAEPVALFFEAPRLIPILQLQSLQFVFLIFAIIPDALLIRRLDFQPKATVETVAALLASGSTLALAYFGFGVWSLIYGVLIGGAARAIGLTWITGFLVWPCFRLSGLDGLVRFGGLLTLERLLWYWYTKADSLIIGKRFGDLLLGSYTVAMTVASLPVDKLGPVLTQVGFPAFAAVQERRDLATAHLLKAVRLVALIGCPIQFGLSAVAPDFVALVLGANWGEAVMPLRLVSLVMPLRLVNLVVPSYLKGLGHAGVSLATIAVASLLLPGAFLLGMPWGLLGISWAWVIAYPLVFVFNLWIVSRWTPLRVRPVLGALMKPMLGAAAMLIVVVVLSETLLADLGSASRLLLVVPCGAAFYIVTMLVIDRAACAELITLLHRRRASKMS